MGSAATVIGDDDRASFNAHRIGAAPQAKRCRLVFKRDVAAQEVYALAGELSRRAERLLRVAPKLRARGAPRVVDLLLSDDCVSASRASKAAGLSDRAARRLFDRLIALGAVHELSGRGNFRLYGL